MKKEDLRVNIKEKIQECQNNIDELVGLYGEFEGVIYQRGLLYACQDILNIISDDYKNTTKEHTQG